MATQQPIWKIVGKLGDIDPITYGGGFVYEDTTGVYPPEVTIIDRISDKSKYVEVSRIVLDKPRFKTLTDKGKSLGLHSAQLPASERNDTWYWYKEWYVDKLTSVAETCGTTKFAMLRMLFSKDSNQRAQVYETLTSYFGLFEFDQYPERMTETQAKKRFKKELKWKR